MASQSNSCSPIVPERKQPVGRPFLCLGGGGHGSPCCGPRRRAAGIGGEPRRQRLRLELDPESRWCGRRTRPRDEKRPGETAFCPEAAAYICFPGAGSVAAEARWGRAALQPCRRAGRLLSRLLIEVSRFRCTEVMTPLLWRS